MNPKRKDYSMLLNASLLCLSLTMGGQNETFAQNTVKKSPQGEVQTRRAVVAKGVVTDDTQDPLPGVTVRVKGTKIATTTDINGHFSLNMPTLEPGKAYFLEFSYIGMEKKNSTLSR